MKMRRLLPLVHLRKNLIIFFDIYYIKCDKKFSYNIFCAYMKTEKNDSNENNLSNQQTNENNNNSNNVDNAGAGGEDDSSDKSTPKNNRPKKSKFLLKIKRIIR
jgi:hypothetical protein